MRAGMEINCAQCNYNNNNELREKFMQVNVFPSQTTAPTCGTDRSLFCFFVVVEDGIAYEHIVHMNMNARASE